MSTRSTRSHVRKQSTASTSALPKLAITSKPRAKSFSKTPASPSISKSQVTKGRAQDVWCVCRGTDDGTPMIKCEFCEDWFHFACISLAERDAEEIQLYVCEACHTRTRQSTVYDWEGPDAIEGYSIENTDVVTRANGRQPEAEEPDSAPVDLGDDDSGPEDDASGDDYKEEDLPESVVVRRGRGTKRITSSEEEKDQEEESSSIRAPSRRTQLKRKRGRETQEQRKRVKKPLSEVETADDDDQDERHRKKGINKSKSKSKQDASLDPTRKYCLGKLREVLLPIFVQFANTSQNPDEPSTEGDPTKEIDDEQRTKAEEDGSAYVRDLEQCLFELYGESDKHGHKAAAGKYKDRFRMLSFNLSQPDRHLLRRSIGTRTLPALQLSKMSSVDLANEQMKHLIEAANRESLEHSILTQRPVLARAKITHKGEEIIEDLVGDDIGRRIRDEEQRERDREREREKLAREKAKATLPPSPTQLKEPTFGPQDILAQQHNDASQRAAQAQAQRKAARKNSIALTESPAEPSFKFDDLIAIDLPDDVPQDNTDSGNKSHNVPSSIDIPTLPAQAESETLSASRLASFDLNNVWSGGTDNLSQEPSRSPMPSESGGGVRDPPNIVDVELGTGADDEDFDIFLDQSETAKHMDPDVQLETETAIFEALPIVWSGNLHIPDLGKSPAIQARQVAGRPIDAASSQWRILFPPTHPPHQLKVDGRVPVKESAKYMTQNRLNVTRELIVVALTPFANRADYDEFISFLVNRDRHAVVHPWGPNPAPDAPGKELYLIPIMPHQPLPDYVDLLDLVKFPKQREDKILLGVFVLNKGKFSEHASPPSLHPTNASTSITAGPLPDVSLYPNPSALASSATQPPLIVPAIPAAQQTPTIPPEIVSKLSTEQIESLFQTILTGGGLNPLPGTQGQQPPPPPSAFPPTFLPSLASLLPQQYPPASYPYPPPAPPGQAIPHYSPSLQQSSIPYNYSPPHIPASPPREQEYRGSALYGGNYGPPGRGDYDRPRGRGGVRGHGGNERGRGGPGNDFDRPRDSGWGPRGRGRGGHQNAARPW